MMDKTPDSGLRESEIALMDAIKTLVELLLMRGLVDPVGLGKIFAFQRDGYLAKEQPTAAALMEHLRQYVTDPARAAERQTIQQLLAKPAQGQA